MPSLPPPSPPLPAPFPPFSSLKGIQVHDKLSWFPPLPSPSLSLSRSIKSSSSTRMGM
jgi:hypothetical protein